MKPRLLIGVIEALEKLQKAQEHIPVYEAVLKRTGDKKQALDVLLLVVEMDQEQDLKKASNS